MRMEGAKLNNLHRILVTAFLITIPAASLPLIGIAYARGMLWLDALTLALIVYLVAINIVIGARWAEKRGNRKVKPELLDLDSQHSEVSEENMDRMNTRLKWLQSMEVGK